MYLLRWIFILELLYVAGWPLCFRLFRCLPDGGFGLARLLGMLIVAYAAWLSAGIGLFPYDAASLWSFLILYLIIAAIIFSRNSREIRSFVAERKRLILFEEGLFWIILLAAVFIQSYKPDITVAEKEPDMMFLQAVLGGGSMPPQDLWFAGRPVNYYYLGYVVYGAMISLSAIRPEFGFNLSVATVVPLASLAAFSLAYNLVRRRGYALLAPLFLFGVGNLDAAVRVLRGSGLLSVDWWYEMFAHGSREIIPGTIHEFPCFSFLLGDLHPHYMFMPFGFLLLTMIYVFFVRKERIFPKFEPSAWLLHGSIFALVLGSVFMFNTWDYPSYLLLVFAAVLAISVKSAGGRKWIFPLWVVALVILSAALFLPFHVWFEPAAKAKLGWVDASKRSPLGAFLTVNGLGLFVMASYLASQLGCCLRKPARPVVRRGLIAAAIVCAVLWLGFNCAVAGIMGAMVLLSAVVAFSKSEEPPEKLFLSLLVFLCACLFLACEFFYLKDFYGERLQRQNTVFKYYFQAWLLMSVIFACGSRYVIGGLRGTARWIWTGVLVALIAASMIYPVWGTCHRCSRFRGGPLAPVPYLPTLDGMAYIRRLYPDEYLALIWIREHIPREDVILEATGDPYSFYGRVATFTGRPTVLGWGNQESLWRDWTWKQITARSGDIARIYDENNKSAIYPLLKKYRVRYIYAGTLEHKKYNTAGVDAFENVFPVVYRNRNVTIYQVTGE